jgi:hypothetical protein
VLQLRTFCAKNQPILRATSTTRSRPGRLGDARMRVRRTETSLKDAKMEQGVTDWFAPLAFFVWLFVVFWSAHKHRRIHDRYVDEISRAIGYRVRDISLPFFDESNIYTEGSEARRLQLAYWRAFCWRVIVVICLLFAIGLSGWLWANFGHFLRAAVF